MTVADETAGICGPRIGDRGAAVRGDYVDIEVDQPLSADGPTVAAHAVGGMAGGASEAVIDVAGMLRKTGIRYHITQIMAFSTESIRTISAEVRIGKKIRDQLPRRRSLAEFVTPLQDVRPLRAMRAVGSYAAKFAIVVAVMAIRAEDLRAHRPPRRYSVFI